MTATSTRTKTTTPASNRTARDNRSRLTRSGLDRVLGGVCGGLTAPLGVGAWWARILFIALTIVQPGYGILLYVLLWVALPAQTLADLPPPSGGAKRPRPEAILIVGILSIIVGVLTLVSNLDVLRGTRGDLIPPTLLFLIGLILFIRQLRRA
jgi:phage shock protein PspC (stress-responsive transcriptional regulator)